MIPLTLCQRLNLDTKNRMRLLEPSLQLKPGNSSPLILSTTHLKRYPLQPTLIFCQFVESNSKGPGLKDLAGWMLFGGVIKVLKIEKMRFYSHFDAYDESSSYLASRSYEALEKKFFTKNCSLGPLLPGDILSFQKRIRFCKVRRTKMFLKWYLLDYKK